MEIVIVSKFPNLYYIQSTYPKFYNYCALHSHYSIPIPLVELHSLHPLHTLYKNIYIYKQGFSRFRFCKIFVHPDGMKFSRMLPRPLETFHSVDEKRPRITFTKIHSGGFSTFSTKGGSSILLLLFFSPLPLFSWNTILRLVF